MVAAGVGPAGVDLEGDRVAHQRAEHLGHERPDEQLRHPRIGLAPAGPDQQRDRACRPQDRPDHERAPHVERQPVHGQRQERPGRRDAARNPTVALKRGAPGGDVRRAGGAGVSVVAVAPGVAGHRPAPGRRPARCGGPRRRQLEVAGCGRRPADPSCGPAAGRRRGACRQRVARASGSPGSTSRPSTPSVTTSGMPPTRVATQASPVAMASSSAIGKPSNRELRANTSKAGSSSSTSRREPANVDPLGQAAGRPACRRGRPRAGPTRPAPAGPRVVAADGGRPEQRGLVLLGREVADRADHAAPSPSSPSAARAAAGGHGRWARPSTPWVTTSTGTRRLPAPSGRRRRTRPSRRHCGRR